MSILVSRFRPISRVWILCFLGSSWLLRLATRPIALRKASLRPCGRKENESMLGGTSHRDIPLADLQLLCPGKSVLYFFRLLSWATPPLLSFGFVVLSIEGDFSTYDRLYTLSSSTHALFLCFAVTLYSTAIVPSYIHWICSAQHFLIQFLRAFFEINLRYITHNNNHARTFNLNSRICGPRPSVTDR